MAYIEKKKRNYRKRSNIKVSDRQEVYQSALWKKIRLHKLMTDPLCEVCLLMGKTTGGDHVHHMISFVNATDRIERDRLAYDTDNLMTVCESCHGRIHGGDLKGCTDINGIKKRLGL